MKTIHCKSEEVGKSLKRKSPKHRKQSSESSDLSRFSVQFISENHGWNFGPGVLVLDRLVVCKHGLQTRIRRSLV